MDERAFRANYAWSRDVQDSISREWHFRDKTVTLPVNAVPEIRHRGYHCLLASWDDVKKAANG